MSAATTEVGKVQVPDVGGQGGRHGDAAHDAHDGGQDQHETDHDSGKVD